MKLAVVIPIYNEQENLPELRRRLTAALDSIPDAGWQVIYVNDGSRDESVPMILRQRQEDPRFTLVELSRNFGHQAAITAGMEHADADAVVVMDGDLQDPPEVIPDMVKSWREGGQVILAERRSRGEKGTRRAGFDLFHQIFGWMSDFPIPSNTGVFGLMDRRALAELNKLPEKHRFLPGLRAWIGFDQRTVLYDRHDRSAGEPKQTFRRLLRYAMDAIFSFSYKPLRLMTAAGLMISGLGFLVAAYFIFKRLMGHEEAATGFTTLVSLVLFLGGIQLIAIGLLGEYLGRIYDEVKHRPHYIVRSTHGLKDRSA